MQGIYGTPQLCITGFVFYIVLFFVLFPDNV